MSFYSNNRSPPPLQHPVPTHPTYIPEPPSTPASPQGYQRYTSSPAPPQPAPPYGAQPVPVARNPQPPQAYVSHTGYAPVASPPRQPTAHGQIPHPTHPVVPVDFSAWGINDATAQMGMQLGQNAVAAGQDYVQKKVRGWYLDPGQCLIHCARSLEVLCL